MRQFRIKNSKGAVYNVTAKEKEFLYNVKGLGFSTDTEYKRVANIYKRLNDVLDQGVINGTIHFFKDKEPHKRYFDLVNFLQEKPLTLEYDVEELNKTFYRSGTVTNLTFDETSPLSADITFTCTTLWYERADKIIKPSSSGEQQGGKRYNYTYNYVYSDSEANTIKYNLITNEPSPVKLSFYGRLDNPVWTHYVNGKEVARGKVNYTIAEGYVLVIDTTNVPYSIAEYDTNGNKVIDLYNFSDFSTKRFIYLEAGENVISVTDDNSNEVLVKAEAMVSYVSV